jgi:hypothetical protein
MTKICYHPSLLLLFFDPGSEIRDPGQCCGSETFISDPVSDPDPANSEFRIRIRIRIRILDLNPDPKCLFRIRLETGQNLYLFN